MVILPSSNSKGVPDELKCSQRKKNKRNISVNFLARDFDSARQNRRFYFLTHQCIHPSIYHASIIHSKARIILSHKNPPIKFELVENSFNNNNQKRGTRLPFYSTLTLLQHLISLDALVLLPPPKTHALPFVFIFLQQRTQAATDEEEGGKKSRKT